MGCNNQEDANYVFILGEPFKRLALLIHLNRFTIHLKADMLSSVLIKSPLHVNVHVNTNFHDTNLLSLFSKVSLRCFEKFSTM